jgi:hypothetical protein
MVFILSRCWITEDDISKTRSSGRRCTPTILLVSHDWGMLSTKQSRRLGFAQTRYQVRCGPSCYTQVSFLPSRYRRARHMPGLLSGPALANAWVRPPRVAGCLYALSPGCLEDHVSIRHDTTKMPEPPLSACLPHGTDMALGGVG